jgi:hypothetical protein
MYLINSNIQKYLLLILLVFSLSSCMFFKDSSNNLDQINKQEIIGGEVIKLSSLINSNEYQMNITDILHVCHLGNCPEASRLIIGTNGMFKCIFCDNAYIIDNQIYIKQEEFEKVEQLAGCIKRYSSPELIMVLDIFFMDDERISALGVEEIVEEQIGESCNNFNMTVKTEIIYTFFR